MAKKKPSKKSSPSRTDPTRELPDEVVPLLQEICRELFDLNSGIAMLLQGEGHSGIEGELEEIKSLSGLILSVLEKKK